MSTSQYPLYAEWASRLQWNGVGGMIMAAIAFLVIAYQLHRIAPLWLWRFVAAFSIAFFAICTLATISQNPPDPLRALIAGVAALACNLIILAAVLDSPHEDK